MTDFEHIVISAERYALGRMTYIVDVTTKYITKQIKENKLSNHCLLIMQKDIKDAKNYGMEMDKYKWIKLLNLLEEEVINEQKTIKGVGN